MQRYGELGSELDSFPIYEFIENLGNGNEFAKSKTITATIEALRAADSADMLQGHGCIGSIQSLLVELLNYVEGKGVKPIGSRRIGCPRRSGEVRPAW